MLPSLKAESTASLVTLASRALGYRQRDLGQALGASHRTAQRWAQGRSTPTEAQVRQLAALVHPKDAALAARLAVHASTTLEALGLVRPPPVVRPRPAAADLVDSVVCAAADARGALPADMRPALLAAFARARKLGLTCDEVEAALAPAVDSVAGVKKKSAPKGAE